MEKAFSNPNTDPGMAATLVNSIVQALQAKKAWALKKAAAYMKDGSAEERLAWARDEYMREISAKIQIARRQPIAVDYDHQAGGKKYVQYYSPPAVIHRVVSGIHEHEPYVRFSTVATAMEASELEPLPQGQARSSYDPYQPLTPRP
jgi:hypothetical protein